MERVGWRKGGVVVKRRMMRGRVTEGRVRDQAKSSRVARGEEGLSRILYATEV